MDELSCTPCHFHFFQEYYYDYEEKVEEKKEEILEEEEEFYHDSEQEEEDGNKEDVNDSQESLEQKSVEDAVDAIENNKTDIIDNGDDSVEVIEFENNQDNFNESKNLDRNIEEDVDNVSEEDDGEVEPTIEDLLNEHLQEAITTTTAAPFVEVVELDLEHDLEAESLIPTQGSQEQKRHEVPKPLLEVKIPHNHSNNPRNLSHHHSNHSHNNNSFGNHSLHHSGHNESKHLQDSQLSKKLEERHQPEDIGIPHLLAPLEAEVDLPLEEESDAKIPASNDENSHELGIQADEPPQAEPTAVDEITKTILGGKVSITVKHLGTQVIHDPLKEVEVGVTFVSVLIYCRT